MKIQIISGESQVGINCIQKTIEKAAQDGNNVIFVIGNLPLFNGLRGIENVRLFDMAKMRYGISQAISVQQVSAASKYEDGCHVSLYLYMDSVYLDYHDRHAIEAAALFGVDVTIFAPKISMIDGGDLPWLTKNCDCMKAEKDRMPYLLNFNELMQFR